jgi:Lipocalin-like domain
VRHAAGTGATPRCSWQVTGERLMVEGLRDQLIGAWKLVSYQERPVDGSEPFEPLGHEPKGIIMYTPDSEDVGGRGHPWVGLTLRLTDAWLSCCRFVDLPGVAPSAARHRARRS